MIDRALVLCDGPEIGAEHLDLEKIRTTRMTTPPRAPVDSAGDAGTPGPVDAPPLDLSPSQLDERARIIATLAECSFNQKLAATRLGISRGTLFSRMQRYGIPGPRAALRRTRV
jgi:DNA-binding NtrC family response regulator